MINHSKQSQLKCLKIVFFIFCFVLRKWTNVMMHRFSIEMHFFSLILNSHSRDFIIRGWHFDLFNWTAHENKRKGVIRILKSKISFFLWIEKRKENHGQEWLFEKLTINDNCIYRWQLYRCFCSKCFDCLSVCSSFSICFTATLRRRGRRPTFHFTRIVRCWPQLFPPTSFFWPCTCVWFWQLIESSCSGFWLLVLPTFWWRSPFSCFCLASSFGSVRWPTLTRNWPTKRCIGSIIIPTRLDLRRSNMPSHFTRQFRVRPAIRATSGRCSPTSSPFNCSPWPPRSYCTCSACARWTCTYCRNAPPSLASRTLDVCPPHTSSNALARSAALHRGRISLFGWKRCWRNV